MSEVGPTAEADLALVIAIEKLGAEGVERQRGNAQRAWTISGALAAVILAAGFTTALKDGSPISQVAGTAALAAWFMTAILFVRTSIPPKTGNKELADLVAAATPSELPPEDTIACRAHVRMANINGATKFVAHRLRVASAWASVAATITVFALAFTVFVPSPEEKVDGVVLLTPTGQDAVADACSQIDGTPTDIDGVSYDLLDQVEVTAFVSDLADETSLVRLRFAENMCEEDAMILFIDRSQLIGVLDP